MRPSWWTVIAARHPPGSRNSAALALTVVEEDRPAHRAPGPGPVTGVVVGDPEPVPAPPVPRVRLRLGPPGREQDVGRLPVHPARRPSREVVDRQRVLGLEYAGQ